MKTTLEIFYNFTNRECHSMLNDLEKLKTEFNVEFKWRAFPEDQKSTKSAYIISKWAEENGLADVYIHMVFYHFHVLKKNIFLIETLKEMIIKTGIYEVKPEYILENGKYIKLVEDDIKEASELKINGTPVILYNGEMLNGCVKYEELVKLIKNISTQRSRGTEYKNKIVL